MQQTFLDFYESLANQAAGNIYKKNSVAGKPLRESNGRYTGLIFRLIGDLYEALQAAGDIDPGIKNPLMQSLHVFSQRLEEVEAGGLDQRLRGASRVASRSTVPAEAPIIKRPPIRP